MSALIRMRLTAYLRTQVAFAPLLAALVVLGILYGGGQAAPAEAYGMSAVVLFPVLASQAKILFDVDPDVQRAIAATTIGSRSAAFGSRPIWTMGSPAGCALRGRTWRHRQPRAHEISGQERGGARHRLCARHCLGAQGFSGALAHASADARLA